MRRWASSNAGEDRGFWLISNTRFSLFSFPISSSFLVIFQLMRVKRCGDRAEREGEKRGRLGCAPDLRNFDVCFRHSFRHSFTPSLQAPGERGGCRSWMDVSYKVWTFVWRPRSSLYEGRERNVGGRVFRPPRTFWGLLNGCLNSTSGYLGIRMCCWRACVCGC